MKFLFGLVFFIVYIFVTVHLYILAVEVSAGFEWFAVSYCLINIVFLAGFLIYQRIFNPFVFIFPFLLSFFYYQFGLSYDQVVLSGETKFVLILFFVFYFVGAFSFCKFKFSINDAKLSAGFVHFIFALGVLVYITEVYLNGGIAILKTIQGYNAYIENKSLPILHYAYMLLALIPSCYYFLYKDRKVGKRFFLVASVLCFFMIFDSLSRQLILLMVFSFFFSYVKLNSLSLDKLFIRLMFFSAAFFILIGSLRYIGGGTESSEIEFMKAYANIKPDYDVSLLEITFNLYTSKNISTLNDIMIINDGDLHLGKYLFQAYIKIFGADGVYDISYDPSVDSYSRLGTIIADPYLDFGIPGVIVFAFLYGVLAYYSYSAYINSKSLSSSLLISVVFYSLFMSPFTNYFNQLFIFICISLSVIFRYRFRLNK